MKKLTKKLLISTMILVVAISLAATSTYAWFTMDDTPEVQGFDVNVTSTDGLYISTLGTDGSFKSYVTTAEVITAIKTTAAFVNEGNLKDLTAATSEDGTTFTNQAGFAMGDTEYTSPDTTNYKFRLFFRSNNAYTVKLDLETVINANVSSVTSTHSANYLPVQSWKDITLLASEGTDNAVDDTYKNASFVAGIFESIATGVDIEADAKDAVRISFTNSATTPATFIWDANAAFGYTDNVYGNIANDYQNFVNGTNLAVTTPASSSVDANTVLLTLTGTDATGYTGYLDVSIWLEGWDANCFNTVLDDKITTALSFLGTLVA